MSNDNFLSKNRYAAEGGPVYLKMPGPNCYPSPPLVSINYFDTNNAVSRE
jgi:hypothetical protein